MLKHNFVWTLVLLFTFLLASVSLKVGNLQHEAVDLDIKGLRNAELARHNLFRSYHGLPPIRLSATLNDAAQKYADSLGYYNQGSKYDHSPQAKSGKYGQNLYWQYSSPSLNYIPGRSSDRWYLEEPDYSYSRGQARYSNVAVGHFTAMIWKKVVKVGFGFSQVPMKNGFSIYVVANYLEVPNTIGQEKENVPRPTASRPKNWKSLIQQYENGFKKN